MRHRLQTATLLQPLIFGVAIAVGIVLNLTIVGVGILDRIPILFYRGLVATALAAVLHYAFLGIIPPRSFRGARRLIRRGRVTVVSLALSFNIVFLIVFPVTIDRSVTVFLLQEIERSGDRGLTQAELENLLISKYVHKAGAVARRLDEQRYSGTVENVGGGFRLSPVGRAFMTFSRIVAHLYRSPFGQLPASSAAPEVLSQ
jgi:hypothetical protein